jgi:hypothetical protein
MLACFSENFLVDCGTAGVARRLLRCGDLASGEDLENKIATLTIRHDKNARPCRWSYDVGAEHARYLGRHLQPELTPAPAEAA